MVPPLFASSALILKAELGVTLKVFRAVHTVVCVCITDPAPI